MASLPPRQHSQRRSSPEQTSSSQPQPNSTSPARARSATSEDSQTLFVNHHQSPDQAETPAPDDHQQQQPQQQPSQSHPKPEEQARPSSPNETRDIKTCWICFADSTEDTPTTSAWRDPCPCALVAHEECLLDWIADMEAPSKNARSRSIRAPRIECPQCKTEIKLSRSRDYVVEAVRGVERLGARSVTPGALAFLSAGVYQSSMLWGMHSIYAVFGVDDGYRILRPLLYNAMRAPLEVYAARPQEAARKLLGLVVDHLVHWRLYVGLPLITPMLILSRTHLANSILPVLPVLFFATQTHSSQEPMDFTQWPPSASLCFAVLPYVRQAYNICFEKVWGAKVKQWLQEVQPRSGAPQDEVEVGVREDQLDGLEADEEEDNVFEVRIDGNIFWDDWEDPQQPEVQQPVRLAQGQQAPPLNQPPAPTGDETGQAQPPPNIRDDRPPPPQPAPAAAPLPQAQPQQAPERRLAFSATTLAETILGALLFPTLAGLSGELLKFLLPISWTALPVAARMSSIFGGSRTSGAATASPTGILQTKWGRSLVGGCAFVVVKDAVLVYVRWRMASMHRGRRVLDYAGTARRAGRR
ncbi:hypothetical protein LTR86_002211 [Recurvomyces mirabilis]|nr:hypothetical protein LTR86_002211 [Recurvomyces mirabilis]